MNNPKYIDYKDVEMLKKYLTTHARIQSRKTTKLGAGAQRNLAQAIKRARFMGLLPYITY